MASPGAAWRTATGKLCGRTYCWRARSRVAGSTAALYQPRRQTCRPASAPFPLRLADLLQPLLGELCLAGARIARLQAHEGRPRAVLVVELQERHAELVERRRHAVALGILRLDLRVRDSRAVVLGQRVERLADAVEGVVGELVVGRGGEQPAEAG